MLPEPLPQVDAVGVEDDLLAANVEKEERPQSSAISYGGTYLRVYLTN